MSSPLLRRARPLLISVCVLMGAAGLPGHGDDADIDAALVDDAVVVEPKMTSAYTGQCTHVQHWSGGVCGLG